MGKNTFCTATLALAALLGSAAMNAPAVMAAQEKPSMEKFAAVSGIVGEKCMPCHSKGYDLPFYSKIPGIKDIIEKDYRDGLRALDLKTELVERKDAPVSEVTLAKMEWVTENKTMPPAKFTAVHWGSRMSDVDHKAVLDWVATTRAKLYATNAAPKRANEPIQPIQPLPQESPAKVALGEKLYNDKRLSGDNTVACVTCHQLDQGGIDNLRYSEGIKKQVGGINAPTVFNAAFNVRQFWNGRAADLQEQAGGPPFNPIEMGSKDWNEVIAKLKEDKELTEAFTAVYADGWSGKNITDAIAAFERTLVTPDSRFDLWLKGDDKALTEQELRGYNLFKAYRCASCHTGKAVGGQSFEYVDLKGPYFADRAKNPNDKPSDEDLGLMGFTKNPDDKHRFKVPTLRNVELTAPYMHDGLALTLDETIDIMGKYLSGMNVPPKDREDITAFLRTLTGKYKGEPVKGSVVKK